jgi:hydroxyacylglutathione hydrolase
MILKRFYDEKLAHASWLVGCAATGQALIVDPNRDAEQYVAAAQAEGLRITHVIETHIHADFVSGTRELAARTGATAYLSDEGGPDWQYGWKAEDTVLVRDGDRFMVGNVRVDVMHTPGHTPEHLCFVITDTAGADRPMGVFTGDFVFVGDVGRPDLLERAAGIAGTMEAGARQLHRSIRRFRDLPDFVQIWPAHGAGSACGKSLGAVPQSTLGYEKLFNWAFGIDDEEAFVQAVLAGQPEPPKYFAEMKRINRDGPPVLGGFHLPQRRRDEDLAEVLRGGATVIDIRPAAEFANGHVPGTIGIPLNRSFNTWAGWLVPYDREFYLFAASAGTEACLEEAIRDLAFVGLDRVAGWFGQGALDLHGAAELLQTTPQMTPAELAERFDSGEVEVLDVRGGGEWSAGHLPGVRNIPLGHLPDRIAELPRDRPIVLHCQSGGRSSIAASVLQAHGFDNVVNLKGGYRQWSEEGRQVERGEAAGVV